jgi:hypothetical protein
VDLSAVQLGREGASSAATSENVERKLSSIRTRAGQFNLLEDAAARGRDR